MKKGKKVDIKKRYLSTLLFRLNFFYSPFAIIQETVVATMHVIQQVAHSFALSSMAPERKRQLVLGFTR